MLKQKKQDKSRFDGDKKLDLLHKHFSSRPSAPAPTHILGSDATLPLKGVFVIV